MVRCGLADDAEPLGKLEHRGALEHGAVLEQRHRQAVVLGSGHLQQLSRLRLAFNVHDASWYSIAGEEVAKVVRGSGEAMPDHSDSTRLQSGSGLPGRQQIFDYGNQLLLRRIPRLEQVVVEVHLVDRLDRRLGVGVGREQYPFGRRHDFTRAHQVVGPRQTRHPLVRHQHRHLLRTADQFAQRLERLVPGTGTNDPVARPEALAHVACHCGQYGRLIIDHEDHGVSPRRLTRLSSRGDSASSTARAPIVRRARSNVQRPTFNIRRSSPAKRPRAQ